MKLILGDLMKAINCEIVSYEELQRINDSSKQDVCGLYFSNDHKIFITDESPVPTLDLLLHEVSHAIIDEQKTLKSEEHKCDMLSIRIKHLLAQRRKIYLFTK
jgi:hypothetical protein